MSYVRKWVLPAALLMLVLGALGGLAIYAGPYRWDVVQPPIERSAQPGFVIGAANCPALMQFHSIGVEEQGRLPANEDGCSVTARGPWFVDPNHAWPFGTGYINIPLVTWARSFQSPSWGYDDTAHPADLRHKTLRVDFTVSGEIGRRPVHFWFQSNGRWGRPVNYYLKQRLNSELTEAERSYSIAIPLDRAEKFQCMGSSVARMRTYGCDISANEALSDVDLDLGLIAFGRSDRPTEGTIRLTRFRID